MSSIQMTGWPMVSVRFKRHASDQDVQQWLNELSAYLDKRQPFSMVIEANPESRFSPEARRDFGLWFKENRVLLGSYCCGVARVVSSAREGDRVVSENMKKAMPFPMVAMTSSDEARKWAESVRDEKMSII
ncbi:hypothetical protein NX722_21485 [Endozoicomonas gorgoniicola]|uniref:STAS/SEC14 domain-containing protein n=1 Tax=Endozoicomonas gorgoniicola TaxID=1234144 RepID=A0ABT3N0K9_9GAMM|nr:hypothetical protein [Endozoicomonas gorgoniicola]MCW7555150.1 hypothetical protein [Endozoicomonas gorgoniicola]